MRPALHKARPVVRISLVLYLLVLIVYSVAPSSMPGIAIISLLPGRDLLAHTLAYGALTVLLCGSVGKRGSRASAGLAVAGGLAVGVNAILELAQALVPWRTASLADFAAGLAGTCVALGAWGALGRVGRGTRRNGTPAAAAGATETDTAR